VGCVAGRTIGIRLVVVVGVVFALAGCAAGTVSPFRVQKDAESLQSLAAEGALLAGATAAGKSTAAFTDVHASELAQQANDLAAVLASSESPPDLGARSARVVRLASLTAATLEELAKTSDMRAATVLQRRLGVIADEAGRLASTG
jgi:hypothetical protein